MIGTQDAFYLVLGAHEITVPANPAPNQMLTFHGTDTGASINFNGTFYIFEGNLYDDFNTFSNDHLSRRFILYWLGSYWYWSPI